MLLPSSLTGRIKLNLQLVPQLAHLLNGDHNCLIRLLWRLNEILYENHTGQSLVHNQHAINISQNDYNNYYSGPGQSVRINLFLQEKDFEFPSRRVACNDVEFQT